MQHFNQLTPAEHERLSCLAEECAEVIQMVGKILRHGYESCHPADYGSEEEHAKTNRRLLEKELGDLNHVTGMLFAAGDVDRPRVLDCSSQKSRRIGQYLHHQEKPI